MKLIHVDEQTDRRHRRSPTGGGRETRANEEAQAAFEEIRVEQVTPDGADALGARAAERL